MSKKSNTKTSKKRSSVRHTRAIGRNRSKRVLTIPPDPKVHDQTFWSKILAAIPPGALLVFDKGFISGSGRVRPASNFA